MLGECHPPGFLSHYLFIFTIGIATYNIALTVILFYFALMLRVSDNTKPRTIHEEPDLQCCCKDRLPCSYRIYKNRWLWSSLETNFKMDYYSVWAASTAKLIHKVLRWTSIAKLCSTWGKKQKKTNNIFLPLFPYFACHTYAAPHVTLTGDPCGCHRNGCWIEVTALHEGLLSFYLSLSIFLCVPFCDCLFNWVFFSQWRLCLLFKTSVR